MSESDKPSKYREWLRQKGWPFPKRERDREGADSVMPHLQEFLEQSRLFGKRRQDKDKETKTAPDKPRH